MDNTEDGVLGEGAWGVVPSQGDSLHTHSLVDSTIIIFACVFFFFNNSSN